MRNDVCWIERRARVSFLYEPGREAVGEHREHQRLADTPRLLVPRELVLEVRDRLRRPEHERRIVARVRPLARLQRGEICERLAMNAEVVPGVRAAVRAPVLAETEQVELARRELLLREADGRRGGALGAA